MQQKVLIYRLGSLGDTIMALPCFHKVKIEFPEADITLLTNKPVALKAAALESVLGKNYFFNRVINYPVGTRNLFTIVKLIFLIRSMRLTTMINLSAARSINAAKRDYLFFKLAGIKKIIGSPKSAEDFTISIDQETGCVPWEASRLANRIKELGEIDLSGEQYWDLKLTVQENNDAVKILPGISNFLVISAGTKMQSKDWEAGNWIRLVRKIKESFPNYCLVLIGAPDEYEVSQKCAEAWGTNAYNICGKTSPRVSAAILKRAALFIGHDSGPMHLAACMGIPCVAIFSARNLPRQWYPRGSENHILYHKTDCAGCNLELCIEQKKKCILSISVDEVLDAARHTLNARYYPA